MKRLRGVFDLTVPEQRVIIVLLSLLVIFVALRTYHGAKLDGRPVELQPSPSPGTRP